MPRAAALRESSAPVAEAGPLQARLRPIVYGLPRIAPGTGAELVASVHSEYDELVGYVVVDRAGRGAAWAPLLAMSGLSVDDACLLARSTTYQLAFLSIPRGSAQCLFTGAAPGLLAEERRAYLDALLPLTERGLLEIVLEDHGDGPFPVIARAGLVASSVAAVVTLLRRLGRPGRQATVGQYLATPLSGEVVRALEREGLRAAPVNEEEGLGAEVDVMLVGAPLWSLESEDAARVRSPVLASVGAARTSLGAEETLHERGVAFVSDTVAAGGRFLAARLEEQGMDAHTAVARTAERVSDRLVEALETFPDRPLAEAARTLAGAPGERVCA